MSRFAPALAHGPLTEVFPDVFFVTGGFRFLPGLSITRNMTVVRQGRDLILVNSVRLGSDGEAALEALGTPRHVVRLGAFHGMDDPYYVDRFGLRLWALPKMRQAAGLSAHEELREDASPIAGSRAFLFCKGRLPEASLFLERDGGILISCDSYQHWTTFEGCSPAGKVMMRVMGFGPTLVGGPWAKAMGPDVRGDFDRLLDLPFRHLLPGHGTVLRDHAEEGLRTALGRRFGG